MTDHLKLKIENSESWIARNSDRINILAELVFAEPILFFRMVAIMVEKGGWIKDASPSDCGK